MPPVLGRRSPSPRTHAAAPRRGRTPPVIGRRGRTPLVIGRRSPPPAIGHRSSPPTHDATYTTSWAPLRRRTVWWRVGREKRPVLESNVLNYGGTESCVAPALTIGLGRTQWKIIHVTSSTSRDYLSSLSNPVERLVSVFHMFPKSTRNLEGLSKQSTLPAFDSECIQLAPQLITIIFPATSMDKGLNSTIAALSYGYCECYNYLDYPVCTVSDNHCPGDLNQEVSIQGGFHG